ncbi:MAG: hypothetical protein ACM3ZE_10825 [Myxococcales bacterium]
MPIYLVRWPDLTASLVRAQDEDDLIDILDQVANPEGCEWSVYDGPLFIDFQLPAEWSVRERRPEHPITPEQIVVDDTTALTGGVVSSLQLSLAEGDDGYDTGSEIIRRAFPALQVAIDRYQDSAEAGETDGVLPESELREALHAELARVVATSWRRAHLDNKQDPVSELARQMDLPITLAQKYFDAAAQGVGGSESPAEPEWVRDTSTVPLFRVSNHHTAACGEPPTVDGDAPQAYFGYFANEYGEQAVYVYDTATGEATIRMGDTGWKLAHRVGDGRIEGTMLSKAEEAWLRACWMATGGRDPRPMPKDEKRTDEALH